MREATRINGFPDSGGMSLLRMSNRRAEKQSYQAVLVTVKKEMAKPRVAQSAKVELQKRCTAKLKGATRI
jgi:hypothetical protein